MRNKIALFIIVLAAAIGAIFYYRNVPSAPRQEALVVKGSDTEVQLVSNLAEAYLEQNPGSDISVTGGGSGAGIAALINGEIIIANSSRAVTDEERSTATGKGIDVREYILARDGLSVIVHPDNSIQTLTMEQVGRLYRGEVTNWRDVGGPDEPVVLYGRQSTSGTYVFFRDTVVRGDYAPTMRNMEGNQAIVDAVITDRAGVGYVGVGYVKAATGAPRSDIKILSIAADATTPAVSPLDREAVLAGQYPIFRRIYQYLAGVPAQGSLLESFLRFESSADGQRILETVGFYSLTADDMAQNEQLLSAIQ